MTELLSRFFVKDYKCISGERVYFDKSFFTSYTGIAMTSEKVIKTNNFELYEKFYEAEKVFKVNYVDFAHKENGI